MSMRVLVSDYSHRTLALATESHVLLFKHVQSDVVSGITRTLTATTTSSGHKNSESRRCMVEFLPKSGIDLKGYRTLTTAKGCLGLITLGDDVFVCVATGSREVAVVRPEESVQQIFAVEFYCLNRAEYDHAGGYGAGYRDGYREPNPYSNTLFEDEHGYDSGDQTSEHPFMALKKLLSGGSFYYSYNFDLTRRLQDRADADSTLDAASLDEGLLWNSYMINPLLSFRSRLTDEEREALDHSSFLTSVIRGYVGTLTVPQSANPIRSAKSNYPATLTLISRLSARRAGTRFNSRGIDDNGNVANFVETETVFWSPTGICFSYVQVRGSIPIFWESSSTLLPGQQKIQITRSPEATQLSFDRHFENLSRHYGSVHVVNLLSDTKPGEVELTERYNLHLDRSSLVRSENEEIAETPRHDLVRRTEFDFHEVTRAAGGYEGAKKIRPLISEIAENFVYFLTQEINDDIGSIQNGKSVRQSIVRPVMVMQQNGVFRTNCLDCLDRTNLVQGIISQMALELFLDHRGEVASSSNLSIFWMRHSSLWADNGDALSKIYAGTGALKSSFTRHGKMSLGGLMADARKSATRLYVNHFEDKGRQNTTDLLLGRLVGQEEVELFDPVSDWVQDRLKQRAEEFESSEGVRVWVGTYNLNGKTMRDESELHKWLDVRREEGYDIVVVGFQEIVELSPQQIMNTDPARRIRWEQAVKKTINETKVEMPQDQYILLRSGQLVGAALMIYVKVSLLSKIKNVEGAIKKTGMSGIAGNKGAVAIRMEVQGSSVCFVTAHLAAGFGNYDERNRDYQTIISGLRFQRDRKIEDHEVVIWLGDFNYRIGTKPEYARDLIDVYKHARGMGPKAENALHDLYKHDQLNIQMVAGQTFPFYQEGAIAFLPTYKFDLGNDNYDSSEKARIPAWTDRILYKVDSTKGTDMRQTEYQSVQSLRFSDHRPVYSTFDVNVRVVDEDKKTEMLQELYLKRTRQLKDGIDDDDESSENELMGYQSIAPGLPPASSDKKKWWIEGDRPIASQVKPPREGMKLNPDRNGNPWRESGEDDWVVVEKEVPAKEKQKSKPAPPAPRRGAAAAESGRNTPVTSERELENLSKAQPPKLPPSRGSTSGTSTPPLPNRMAGAWPPSRNVSAANTFQAKPSPPFPTPRNTHTPSTSSPAPSILDSDDQPLDLPKALPSRSASNASTTSALSSVRSRTAGPPPIRPTKPSSLSAQPRAASITNTSTADTAEPNSLRSLSPRPESEFESEEYSPSTSTETKNHPIRPVKPRRLSAIIPSPGSTSAPSNRSIPTQPNVSTDTNTVLPPPLPRRTNTNASVASNVSNAPSTSSGGPPLPPRRAPGIPRENGHSNDSTTNRRDLLSGDDENYDDGYRQQQQWKALLPGR